MPQIIRKERAAHLASYTFLQEMLINIKTRHFYSSINHQEHLFHRTLTFFKKQLFYITPPEAVVRRCSSK